MGMSWNARIHAAVSGFGSVITSVGAFLTLFAAVLGFLIGVMVDDGADAGGDAAEAVTWTNIGLGGFVTGYLALAWILVMAGVGSSHLARRYRFESHRTRILDLAAQGTIDRDAAQDIIDDARHRLDDGSGMRRIHHAGWLLLLLGLAMALGGGFGILINTPQAWQLGAACQANYASGCDAAMAVRSAWQALDYTVLALGAACVAVAAITIVQASGALRQQADAAAREEERVLLALE